jgi:hypothetical protein
MSPSCLSVATKLSLQCLQVASPMPPSCLSDTYKLPLQCLPVCFYRNTVRLFFWWSLFILGSCYTLLLTSYLPKWGIELSREIHIPVACHGDKPVFVSVTSASNNMNIANLRVLCLGPPFLLLSF